MLRPPHLSNHLESTPPPRLISGQAQSAENQAIDLFCEKELREYQLRLFGEDRHRLVADAKQRATRN